MREEKGSFDLARKTRKKKNRRRKKLRRKVRKKHD